MDVRILRLIGGEWVVAEVIGESSDDVSLKNPCMIMPQEGGIGMGPFSPFSNGDAITIKKDHVLFIDMPNPDLRNGYAQQFGGVVLPEGGSIITG